MKFEVGEKVRVREDLQKGCRYYMLNEYGNSVKSNANTVVDEMWRLRGQIVTITRILSNGQYQIKENGIWNWTDEMFENMDLKIKPVTNINQEIQQLQQRIKKLENLKQNRFNKRTLVLSIYEEAVPNLQVRVFDEDIKQHIFWTKRKVNIFVFRYKNEIEVNILYNGSSGIGFSKCQECDVFDYTKGIALALNRAKIDLHQKMQKVLLEKM